MNGRVVIHVGHQADRPEVDAGAFMYCSYTGWAFGPLFDSADDCREFLGWLDGDKGGECDPRTLGTTELHDAYTRWLVETRRTV